MPLPPFLRWLSSSQAQSPPLQQQQIQEQIDPTAFSASPTQEDQYWGQLASGTEEDYYWRRLSDNWYAKDVIPSTYLDIHNACYEAYNANPLAFAIPAGKEPAFVLDFATTTVPKGKLEVYNRKSKQLNPGWAIDAHGHETLDPQVALKGALLPLGGFGVDNGGHKGYGLGLLVEIICGVLSGGAFGLNLPLPSDGPQPGKISHFFAAFKVDGFRDPAEFRRDMDAELRAFKDSAKAPGQDRIYVAGEIEYEKTLYAREHGVPVHVKVWDELQKLGQELGIPFDLK